MSGCATPATGVRAIAHTDFEHILVGQIVERNKPLERNFPPRREIPGGGEKAIVDLLEIGGVARRLVQISAPVVAHRRGFPPRPVGGLPTLVLVLVTRRLGGLVKSGGFCFRRLVRKTIHSPVEVGGSGLSHSSNATAARVKTHAIAVPATSNHCAFMVAL